MGPIAQIIVDAMKRTGLEECRRDGFPITDALFTALEKELDGRHSTHGWYGVQPEAHLFGVRLHSVQGSSYFWPKAYGPYPCPSCSGTGFASHELDGSQTSGSGKCGRCNGDQYLPGAPPPDPPAPDAVEEHDIL